MKTICKYLTEEGKTPQPPLPAYCIVEDGKPTMNYLVTETLQLVKDFLEEPNDGRKA